MIRSIVLALAAGLVVTAVASGETPRTVAKLERLRQAANGLADAHLREETLAGLQPRPCVRHRIGLTRPDEQAILRTLRAEGLMPAPADDAQAERQHLTVFPPLAETRDATCPRLPQTITMAPGGNGGSHHDWPGGLVDHEAFNLRLGMALADLYEAEGDRPVDRDALVGSILWHDWAKALVLVWRQDGTLTPESPIAGAGAHHVLGLAEAMARGLPPSMILTQACAHAAPVGEDRERVAGWLRAAAVIARVDWTTPVVPTRECLISNAADDNWVHAETAVHDADAALVRLAPRFGHSAVDGAEYRTRLRNPALEALGADRIKALWESQGDAGIERALREAGL
ncbi:hypothetical protein AS593_13225 [Caulobacter vibrioides]|nr:hypothetical protein AS593_13225 [Caulobacter vibrioides]